MRAALILVLAACGSTSTSTGGGCDELLTAADVSRICGAPATIEKTVAEGMTTPMRDVQVLHVCRRDILFGGDQARRIALAVNRMTPPINGPEAVANTRKLITGRPTRDAGTNAYFLATDTTREVHGGHGELLYQLTMNGSEGKPWVCSDDGVTELAKLLQTRFPTFTP